jgi:hypothetical protein
MNLAVLTFILLSGLALVGPGILFYGAKSAVHEIEALMLVLIAAVLFVGAAVVEAIFRAVDRLDRR